MVDPTFELIQFCIRALKADPIINDYVDGRIYDRAPEDEQGNPILMSPYISLNTANLFSDDDYDCIDAVSINLSFNVYSWGAAEAYNSTESRKIAFAVRKCLNRKEFELAENGLVDIQHTATNYTRARDGVTWQAVVSFEVEIDILD